MQLQVDKTPNPDVQLQVDKTVKTPSPGVQLLVDKAPDPDVQVQVDKTPDVQLWVKTPDPDV